MEQPQYLLSVIAEARAAHRNSDRDALRLALGELHGIELHDDNAVIRKRAGQVLDEFGYDRDEHALIEFA